MHRQRAYRILLVSLLAVAVGAFILAGPLGTWLQCREMWPAQSCTPDAVYLVAGAKHQDRRIKAIVKRFTSLEASGGKLPVLLVANDRAVWRPFGVTNRMTRAQRGRHRLGEIFKREVSVIPGRYTGTDGEMDALAEFLESRLEIRSIVLVTAAFHVRRVVWRLETHLDRDVAVRALGSDPVLSDRAPWVVAMELGKMLRDRLGLSRAALLSRPEKWVE